MGKVTLLFAGKSYDTDVQNVRENQIVIFDGPYNMRQRMVVAGIAHTQSGYNYRLIDPRNRRGAHCRSDPPLAGQIRYRALLRRRAPRIYGCLRGRGAPHSCRRPQSRAGSRPTCGGGRRGTVTHHRRGASAADRSRRCRGRQSSANSTKANATPIRTISARVSCARCFSDSRPTRAICSPKCARPRPGSRARRTWPSVMPSTNTVKSTAWGTAITSARTVIRAGRSARNRAATKRALSSVSPSWPEIPRTYVSRTLHPCRTPPPETVADARVEIVEYSAKSIAVFGDTKPLRDTLRDLNGLFRAYLTHDGTRCAGWIFSKRREQEVRSALAAYLK